MLHDGMEFLRDYVLKHLWVSNVLFYLENALIEGIEGVAETEIVSGSLDILIGDILLLQEVVSQLIDGDQALHACIHVAIEAVVL